jgi:phospholipase/lecithinase/hemolysin
MKIRNSWFYATAAALSIAAVTVPTAAAPAYDRIVVFGTSLSDSGNAFALRGGTSTPPDYDVDPLLVPGTPYAAGGHHFTNGATWVEQFARPLGLSGSVRPAFASTGTATNFAVGGARAYDDGINLNLGSQVDVFLQQSGGMAPSTGLYVIEMGSNDIRDALVAFPVGGHGVILQAANVAIAASVQRLYAAGARNFLVWRPPNVALTPAIRRLDMIRPGTAQLATALTQAFNGGLDAAMGQLSLLPGIHIARLDAFRLLNDLVADPPAFGLTNVTTACITPSIAPFFCQAPDEFLFWDGIHPSRAVHTITAQEAALSLAR